MVAIKDMETPRWCGECPMCREETIQSDTYTYCTLLNQDITWNGNRVDDCPLVEIGTCKDCAIKQLERLEQIEQIVDNCDSGKKSNCKRFTR